MCLEADGEGEWQRPGLAMVKQRGRGRDSLDVWPKPLQKFKPWIWWTTFWKTGQSLWTFLDRFGWMHWIGQDQLKAGLYVWISWNIWFWTFWVTWTFFWNTELYVSTLWVLSLLMTPTCGCSHIPETDWRRHEANATLHIMTTEGFTPITSSRVTWVLLFFYAKTREKNNFL